MTLRSLEPSSSSTYSFVVSPLTILLLHLWLSNILGQTVHIYCPCFVFFFSQSDGLFFLPKLTMRCFEIILHSLLYIDVILLGVQAGSPLCRIRAHVQFIFHPLEQKWMQKYSCNCGLVGLKAHKPTLLASLDAMYIVQPFYFVEKNGMNK